MKDIVIYKLDPLERKILDRVYIRMPRFNYLSYEEIFDIINKVMFIKDPDYFVKETPYIWDFTA